MFGFWPFFVAGHLLPRARLEALRRSVGPVPLRPARCFCAPHSFMPLSQRFDHNRDTCACTCVTRLVWRRRVPWGLGVLATGGSSSSGSSSRRVRSTALFFQVRLRVALFAWVLVYGGLAFLPATREARATLTRRDESNRK